MGNRILITGSSGYLGSKLVDILAVRGGWDIHGVDVRAPGEISKHSHFTRASVADKFTMDAAFELARPDVAVHLAFVVTTTHDRNLEESVAIDGTRNFLDACERLRVPKAVFLSSAAVYGAHDDNDFPLTESSPVRGVEGYGYSRLKAKADVMAQEFAGKNSWCAFTILRPCLFVGRNTNNNFFDVLKYPIVPRVKDFKGVRDPLFQFIHEDDMALCLLAAIEKEARGIFNVAGDGTAPFSELVRLFGKRTLSLPAGLLYPATALLWKLHLVTSPPAQLDFIRYPWIMDASKMKRELYTPNKTSIEAFKEFARTHK